MNIATKVLAIYMVSLVGFFASVAESYAATRAAASCSLSDVGATITSASMNDIITVPAGSCTWSDTLFIKKGINLVGAGVGNTVITNGGSGTSFLIVYSPSSDFQTFRLSGFTFNLNNKFGLRLVTNSEPTTQANTRIDHNRFTNSTQSRAAIQNKGIFGVIDNNMFDAMEYPLGVGESQAPPGATTGVNAWTVYADNFHGTADNLYVEDNVFTDLSRTLTDCDVGGRYAFRYNSLSATGDMFPYFDTHEWGATGYGCMGAEIYGNTANRFGKFLAQQGAGRDIVHHNQLTDTSSVLQVYSDGSGGCSPALASRQIINNSYFFKNRIGATGQIAQTYIFSNTCGTIEKNSRFWDDNLLSSFNGTSGVGSGTLAARPATCTTGVAYWATNQSTTNLTGMVGVNPSTPISGTLYKCTSTNTWTAWYTPFTYPHPLRTFSLADDPQGPPSVPQDLRIN